MQNILRLLLLAGLSLTACAPYATRYRENLEAVHIPKWVKLTPSDREAIAALIAREDRIGTLVGITNATGTWRAFTLNSQDASRYDLVKVDGQWRVTQRLHGITPFVAQLVLADTPGQIQKRRASRQ